MTKWCKRPIHKDWEEGTKIKFSRKYSLPVFCFIPPTLLLDTSHPDPASKNSSFLHDKSYFFFEWPVYKKKSCSGTLPSEKILAGFYKTAFAHVLIVSPWPSLPGWASQSVICREVGPALSWWPCHRKRMTQLGGSPLWSRPLFVSHINGSPRFVRKILCYHPSMLTGEVN